MLLFAKGLLENSVGISAYWTFLSKMSTGEEEQQHVFLLTLELLLLQLPLFKVEIFVAVLLLCVVLEVLVLVLVCLVGGEEHKCLAMGVPIDDDDEDDDTMDSLFMLRGNFLKGWFLC